jgi:CBS domain-containing protein
MLEGSKIFRIGGYNVGISFLPVERGLNMLSSVVTKYKELKGLDAAFGIFCTDRDRCLVIGRGGRGDIDVGAVVRKLGGGGHPAAGSAMVRTEHPTHVYRQVVDLLTRTEQPRVRVKDIMSEPKLSLSPTISVAEARRFMEDQGIQAAVVADNGKLVGLISVAELAKARTDPQLKAPIKSFMKSGFPILHPDQTARDAVHLMSDSESGLLPVVDQERVLGAVTRSDLMLYIYEL